MTSLGHELAVQEAVLRAGLSKTSEAVCVDIEWADRLVVLDVAGGEIAVPWVGFPPNLGDRVQVGYLGQSPVCLGAKYGAVGGTVQTVSAGVAVVVGDDGVVYSYAVPSSLSVVSSSVVRLDHAGRLVASVVTTPPPPPPPPDPDKPKPPTSTVKSRWFKPTSSGNYRYGNFHSGAAEVSDNRMGVYWYGTQIRDSIPNSAEILECKIVLRQNWDNVPGVNSSMRLHTQTRPGGTPSLFGGPWSIPGGSRTVGLSVSTIGDLFKSGAAFGIGFATGHGWRQYASRATSGQIFVKWRT